MTNRCCLCDGYDNPTFHWVILFFIDLTCLYRLFDRVQTHRLRPVEDLPYDPLLILISHFCYQNKLYLVCPWSDPNYCLKCPLPLLHLSMRSASWVQYFIRDCLIKQFFRHFRTTSKRHTSICLFFSMKISVPLPGISHENFDLYLITLLGKTFPLRGKPYPLPRNRSIYNTWSISCYFAFVCLTMSIKTLVWQKCDWLDLSTSMEYWEHIPFSFMTYLLDFFCSGIQIYLLLSPYLCFISFLYLDLYVLGDDALKS